MHRTTGLVLIASLALGTVALAGKPERERAKELEKLIKAAKGEIRKSCGCGPSIVGKWQTFPDVHKMFDTVDAIKTAAVGHCSDAESKKKLCKGVSGFEISFTTERYDQPKLRGKTVVTYCTDMKYTNSDELKKLLDKF